MTPIRWCSAPGAHSRRSRPSSVIRPSVGSYSRVRSLISVVLPLPFSPTIASLLPGGMWRSTAYTATSVEPGYENDTPSNRTPSPGTLPTTAAPPAVWVGVSRNS